MVSMAKVLAFNWWALALRGAAGIIAGVLAWLLPEATLFGLTVLFGAYALIDGILSFIVAFRAARHHARWWPLLLEGIAGVGVGLGTIARPAITLVALLYVIGAWAVITGVLEILAGVRLRRSMTDEWLLVLTGITSVGFGVLLFVAPGPGSVVLASWIGIYLVVFGILMLALSLRLRGWDRAGHP